MYAKTINFVSRNLENIVLFFAVVLSVVSFFHYYSAGLTIAYGDSKGHLDIARRVVDSLTPGIAQLGGYWLPLLQILMLPTIWIDFMWHSGISGVIPNMIAYVVTVVFIYKLTYLISSNKICALISSVIVMFNLNLLYMQSTPMTESLFLGTLTLFMYFFYKWIRFNNISDLIVSAIFVMLSSLNRYEAWATVAASSFLLFWEWIISHFDKNKESILILFSSVAFLGIFLWILWGLIIFKDPLEFLHNTLSAGNQTGSAFVGVKPTGYYDLLGAVLTNLLSIKHTSGYILLALCGIGILSFLIKNIKKIYRLETLAVFLLITPFLFDILTVFIGNVPVEVPELSKLSFPGNYFNIRYSLYALPAIALFVGLISKRKIIQILLFLLIFINYALFLPTDMQKIVLLKDAGVQAEEYDRNGMEWFKNNYNGGLILASTGSEDGFMHDSGINQKNYIVEGTYTLWDESLKYPAKYATWVIMSEGNARDSLYKKINKKALLKDFEIKYRNKGFIILKLKKDYGQ